MIPARNRLIERMDQVAGWTGVPRLYDRGWRPRDLRWLPILPLLLGTGGIVLFIMQGRWAPVGPFLVVAGYLIAMLLAVIGPIGARGGDDMPREIRRNAYLFSFGAISLLAIIGSFGLGSLLLIGYGSRGLFGEILLWSGFYLASLQWTLPTLHASWARVRARRSMRPDPR